MALSDEAAYLEKAGIGIIHLAEPAVREGLPLRRYGWYAYLESAVDTFDVTAAVVDDIIQIHTEMRHGEFIDLMGSIAALDGMRLPSKRRVQDGTAGVV